MLHRRPTCLWRPLADRHAYGVQSEFKTLFYILFAYLYRNIERTLNQACRSLMGLRLGMSVSNGSLIRHVCWSPTKHVDLQSDMSVSDGTCRSQKGLRSVMSVSNGSPILRIHSFVNSQLTAMTLS